MDTYAAPGSGASGNCINATNAENIQFLGTQITSFPGGGENKASVVLNSSVNCILQGMVVNHSTGVYLNTCYGCNVDVSASQFSGSAKEIIKAAGGYANRLAAATIGVSGSIGYATGVVLSSTGGTSVDLSRVLDSAVGKRLTLDGTTYNGAGNIPGANFVVRPGAAINTSPS